MPSILSRSPAAAKETEKLKWLSKCLMQGVKAIRFSTEATPRFSQMKRGLMMATTFEGFSFAGYVRSASQTIEVSTYQQTYEANRHRLYALSFWMTDNELTAEELMQRTFRRAFSVSRQPSAEGLDRALIAELRSLMPIGALSLNCSLCEEVVAVRRNTMRVHLERAVVQLPATERLAFLMHDVESYDHARVGRCLGLTENQSKHAVHQARLRIRELLAAMAS
jgi:RNA polymerase sigma-70 factor (ECF subfamily)